MLHTQQPRLEDPRSRARHPRALPLRPAARQLRARLTAPLLAPAAADDGCTQHAR